MVIFWERCDTMFFSRENHWHQWFFDGFAPLWPSPLTTFLITDYWTRWFFNGFGVIQPSPFNDFQPPDHWFQWFFDGFQILDTNCQRWLWKYTPKKVHNAIYLWWIMKRDIRGGIKKLYFFYFRSKRGGRSRPIKKSESACKTWFW